jgi:flagellar basal-body rod protein FlgC
MELIAQNLANVNTTRTPEGGPYRRKEPVFASVDPNYPFAARLDARMRGVMVPGVIEDKAPPKLVFNPSHPDAGPDGFVRMPNVNPISEMINMMAASRAYEANVAAIQNFRQMIEKALTIGQQ